jgi:hypothetical protein
MVGGNSGNHDEPIGQPVPPYTFLKQTTNHIDGTYELLLHIE